jgi:hypothetical protein
MKTWNQELEALHFGRIAGVEGGALCNSVNLN